MSRTGGFALLMGAVLALSPRHGQASTPVRTGGLPAAPALIQSVTLESLQALLLEDELPVRIDPAAKALQWRLEGFTTQLFVLNEGTVIQFHLSFGDATPAPSTINRWNRLYMLSRTYLDEEQNPHLEAELALKGGVSQARLRSFLQGCRESMNAWMREVIAVP